MPARTPAGARLAPTLVRRGADDLRCPRGATCDQQQLLKGRRKKLNHLQSACRDRSSPPTSSRCPRACARRVRPGRPRSSSTWSAPTTSRRGAGSAAAEPARDGRQDRHLVAVGHLGREAVEEADVLTAEVDVDEAAQGAVVVGDALAQLGVLVVEASSTSPTVAAVDLASAWPPAASRSCVGSFDLDRHQATVAKRRLEVLDRRRDLGDLERAAHGVERLQAVAGDVGTTRSSGSIVAALGELGQHRDRDAAGGLGEDAGGLGEQADRRRGSRRR